MPQPSKTLGILALSLIEAATWGCSSSPQAKNGAPSSGGSAGSSTVASGGATSSGGTGAGGPGAGGTSNNSGGTSNGAAGGASSDAGTSGNGGDSSNGWLRDRYPGDEGITEDPAVLFHDDFETGWGRWDEPSADTAYLHLEQGATAHAGNAYLRSTVTEADLEASEYISSSTHVDFDHRVDHVFWRFHARFPTIAPNPHHWIRMNAGNDDYQSSGLANTVPPGDEGFWFDFDASTDNLFDFYVYWHAMRSGRCNDGSVTPGCEGDQGSTYHYGNFFQPPDQTPFVRDAWFCIEIEAVANGVDDSNGALAFWIDDEPVGAYGPGYPDGTWLRDSFHEGGCEFSACTEPVPFSGFDFRTSADVAFKGFFMDAYYERDTTASRRAEMEDSGLTVSDEQTILYDDIVVATERIGCRAQ